MQLSKKFFYLFFLILAASNSLHAQQIYLKVKGSTENESTFLKLHLTDSVSMNGQDAEHSLNQLQEHLKSEGFLHHQITSTQKQDSLYVVQFDLGIKTDSVKIHFKENIELLQELLNIEDRKSTRLNSS